MQQHSTYYKQCSQCILDTNDDPEIFFDEKGICNHCHIYNDFLKNRIFLGEVGDDKLIALIKDIKESGRGKEYDCVLGISGGTDSTYVAWVAKQLGLRPLVVHLDNGWNSELSVKNIENVLNKLGFDLYTHVIDWEEFRDLQLSFLKASVVDIEMLTDHAIAAIIYKIAAKYNLKYILSGENISTEGLLPASWVHNKNDLMNIKSIHNKFGKKKLKTFPQLGFAKLFWYEKIKHIKYIPILNFIDYNKVNAKQFLTESLSWRDYGGKHYESIWTRFYQSYILPRKFHIDKRKSHYSTLICSGQMTKEQALEEMKRPIIDEQLLKTDKEFVIKKFGLTDIEFENIMKLPVKKHTDYESIMNVYKQVRPLYRVLKPLFSRAKPKTQDNITS